ncbi:MAG: AAA family ATPase [Victivallaceae bacterium]
MNNLNEVQEMLTGIKTEVSRVIIGQDEAIDLILITILSNSHALLEGVPGIAKTLMIRTIGRIIDCPTGRIQFTPDLMPSDITGTNIYNMQQQNFNLVKGPVFTGLLLADEINRAPAKTQSALLQCMQERQVTIDSHTYPLPHYFTVFATQNPIEYEGTYPLPEAQKDRFLFKIDMDYPSEAEERLLATMTLSGETPEHILDSGSMQQLIHAEELPVIRRIFNGVMVREEIMNYIITVVRRTRSHNAIMVGAGPRAIQALLLSCRILAVLNGRDFVTPDDVKKLAMPVLQHRLILRPEFEIEGMTVIEAINNLLNEVPVPR